MTKKIFIGVAWPYANNSLHLGHVSALIGADVLARYYRAAGADVLMVSGSDCHGTPIVVSAEQAKTTPSELANKYHKEFVKTLVHGINFSYDNFTTTLTDTHKKTVQKIFLDLLEKKLIYTKTEQLPYCANCDRFLPDRYVEGECYHCHFADARGDQCDECGNLIDPKLLTKPRCKVCGETPVWKDSEHFFLKLTSFQDKLEKWSANSTGWRTNAVGFTKKILNEGLRDRAITRDTDWGIEIPIEGYESKRIYVWFDAVIGYLSGSIEWAQKSNQPDAYKDFWQNDKAIHYYVHGKDNIPFHTLIWPAMLMGEAGLHLPDRIISSEYLTLEKSQFSKSRKHAVWLPDFLANFDADILRYFLIANGPETSDADFSWQELKERVNSELIGNLANCVNRTVHLIKNNFPDGIGDGEIEDLSDIFNIVGNLIEQGKFREALKNVLLLSEQANKHLAVTEPWKKVQENRNEAAKDLYKSAIYCITIAKLLNPFLPETSKKILKLFGIKPSLNWKPVEKSSIKVLDATALFDKIDDAQVDREIQKLAH